MTKKEFLELIKYLKDEEEICFYVWGCERDKEDYGLRIGKIIDVDGGDINLRVN